MTSDLETLLRETLANRADTVHSGPPWDQHSRPSSPRAPRWAHRVAPLVAAAAVLGLVATATFLEHSTGTDHHAGRSASPTVTPRPTTTTSPSPIDHAACTTSLPTSWRDAVRTGTTDAGAVSVQALDASANGAVLIARDFGTARDVALIEPNGSIKQIYSVPAPNRNDVAMGSLDGPWALLPVQYLPRDANGVIPPVIKLVLINVRTGTHRLILSVTRSDVKHERTFSLGATIYAGHVYYDMRAKFQSRVVAIHDYDIATNSDRVIARTSNVNDPPTLFAEGVSWGSPPAGDTISVRRALPPAVAAGLTTKLGENTLRSDGRSYAWVNAANRIDYYSHDAAAVQSFTIPRVRHVLIDAVVGSLVFYSNDQSVDTWVLDVRTAATAKFGGLLSASVGGGGVFASTIQPKSGSTASKVLRLRVADLPGLTC